MSNAKNLEERYELRLISGLPLDVDNKIKIYPLTMRDIGGIGLEEYNRLISILLIEKEDIQQTTDKDLGDVSSFDILSVNCFHSEVHRKNAEDILSYITKQNVTFLPDHLMFNVGNIKDECYINNDNYNKLVDIIKVQNRISKESKKEQPQMSAKAKRLAEKRARGRQMLKDARGEGGITLPQLISVLGVFTKDLDSVLDMTIYQLHDQYERFIRRLNYEADFEKLLVGAEAKDLNLDIHWTSKNIEKSKLK